MVFALDMGSDMLRLAIGEVKDGRVNVIEMMAGPSAGIKRGVVVDEMAAANAIRSLLKSAIDKYKEIPVLKLGLGTGYIRPLLRKVENTELFSRTIKPKDIKKLETSCVQSINNEYPSCEITHLIDLRFFLDDKVIDPLDRLTGTNLMGVYMVYIIDRYVKQRLTEFFAKCDIDRLQIFPRALSVGQLLVDSGQTNFAYLDFGLDTLHATIYQDKRLISDFELPMGMRAVDNDLNKILRLESAEEARLLKEDMGDAIATTFFTDKPTIWERIGKEVQTKKMARVIQSRMEELLEAFIYQLGDDMGLSDGVFMGGAGAKLSHLSDLMHEFSGYRCCLACDQPEFLGVMAMARFRDMTADNKAERGGKRISFFDIFKE